jgi:hypothetical protein
MVMVHGKITCHACDGTWKNTVQIQALNRRFMLSGCV